MVHQNTPSLGPTKPFAIPKTFRQKAKKKTRALKWTANGIHRAWGGRRPSPLKQNLDLRFGKYETNAKCSEVIFRRQRLKKTPDICGLVVSSLQFLLTSSRVLIISRYTWDEHSRFLRCMQQTRKLRYVTYKTQMVPVL